MVSPVPPTLVPAARALAERVLADRVQPLRLSRQLGWLQLAGCLVAVAYGLFVVATGSGGSQAAGSFVLGYAVVWGAGGVVNAIIVPRRARERARRVLVLTADDTGQAASRHWQ